MLIQKKDLDGILFQKSSPQFKFLFTTFSEIEVEELTPEKLNLFHKILTDPILLDYQSTEDIEWIAKFVDKYDFPKLSVANVIYAERIDHMNESNLRQKFFKDEEVSTEELNRYSINPFDVLDDFLYFQTAKFLPGLIKKSPTISKGSAIVKNIMDFQNALNESSDNLFEEFNWDNVVLAGGAVLKSLLTNSSNFYSRNQLRDYDLFLYGMNYEEALEKVKEITEFFMQKRSLFAVRNKYTITLSSDKVSFQIILRIYSHPVEVLLGFDLDSVKLAFDGTEIIMLPSCQRSILHQYNLAESDSQVFRTGTFERRLAKYEKRGFRIRVPKFRWSCVNAKFIDEEFSKLPGFGKLLRLTEYPIPRTRNVIDHQIENDLGSEENVQSYDCNIQSILTINWMTYDAPQTYLFYQKNPDFIWIPDLNDNTFEQLFDTNIWYQEYRNIPRVIVSYHDQLSISDFNLPTVANRPTIPPIFNLLAR